MLVATTRSLLRSVRGCSQASPPLKVDHPNEPLSQPFLRGVQVSTASLRSTSHRNLWRVVSSAEDISFTMFHNVLQTRGKKWKEDNKMNINLIKLINDNKTLIRHAYSNAPLNCGTCALRSTRSSAPSRSHSAQTERNESTIRFTVWISLSQSDIWHHF